MRVKFRKRERRMKAEEKAQVLYCIPVFAARSSEALSCC